MPHDASVRKPFFENHISVEEKNKSRASTHGAWIQWTCFLSGEKVGQIEYRENPGRYQKHYEAYCYYPDEYKKDGYCRRSVGSFDTLYAARRAMLEPARELVKIGWQDKKSDIPVACLPENDQQFYPTPSDVAGKLLSGVDWRFVEAILEPSAGRGDLIEYAIKRNRNSRGSYSRDDLRDIDCIEIDPNLRALLNGKGFRVVHDDFLDYHTRKRYDLILMNPPFVEGDLHLLHAIELCEHGGQIACILNAETVLNPFTNSRRALMKELHRRNASIRIEKRAFSRSARKTDVDVALINVNIPYENRDDSIWEGLEKARSASVDSATLNEVAPANQVERLIREYDLMCEAGIELMKKYNGVAPRIHNSRDSQWSAPIISLHVNGDACRNSCSPHDVNSYLVAVRARFWRELFDLPELREKMTSAMRDEYHETISKMKYYEFSMFNVRQVIEMIMSQIVVGVEDAIVKCFDKLSAEHSYHTDIANENVHYYNGWKTNKAHYVNSKCIIPTYGCFARGYKTDKNGRYKDTMEGLDVRGCFQVLDDLEKALDYLDKGETEATSLERMLQIAANNGKTTVTCKYFTVTFYKKGTCHIKFHDQKIVDRLNIYVGRHRSWLPPSYGSVRYDEMDTESRRVVDEFQGREKYAEVINCPNDYIIETKAAPLLLM